MCPRHRSLVVLVAVTGAVCATTSIASARTSGSWQIEVVGAACVRDRHELERQVELACAAVHTCGLARGGTENDLVATLDCSTDVVWTLSTRTAGGALLTSITLDGDRADRFRQAAVQIARDAPTDPETEPVPDDASIITAPLTIADEADRDTSIAHGPERVSLLLATRMTPAISSGSLFGPHLGGAVHLGHGARATASVTADLGSSERVWRGGLGLAAGAPFDHAAIFGVAFEGGFGAIHRAATSEWATARTDASPYCQGMLVLQVPGRTVRPFLAGGVIVASLPHDATHLSSLLEVGVALPLLGSP